MGRVDIDQMLSELTPAQFIRWQAAIEVIGVDPVQRQIAHLTSTIQAALWDREKHGEPPTAERNMGLIVMDDNAPAPIKWQTPEEMIGILKASTR